MTDFRYPTSEDIAALSAAQTHLAPEEKVSALEAAIRRYRKVLCQSASIRKRRVGQNDSDSLLMRALEWELKEEMSLVGRAIVDAVCVLDSPEYVCFLDLIFGFPLDGHIVPGVPPPPVSTQPSESPPVLIFPDTMQEVFRLMAEGGLLSAEFYNRDLDVQFFPRSVVAKEAAS